MLERCEIVELRFPIDTVGYDCTRSATHHCDDCGISLCSAHSEKCDRCRLIFCCGCMSFHLEHIHSKSATGVRVHKSENGRLNPGCLAAAHFRSKPFITRSIQSARTAITPSRPLNGTTATRSICAARSVRKNLCPNRQENRSVSPRKRASFAQNIGIK
jgi:hypothetical protein